MDNRKFDFVTNEIIGRIYRLNIFSIISQIVISPFFSQTFFAPRASMCVLSFQHSPRQNPRKCVCVCVCELACNYIHEINSFSRRDLSCGPVRERIVLLHNLHIFVLSR